MYVYVYHLIEGTNVAICTYNNVETFCMLDTNDKDLSANLMILKHATD